MKDLTRQLGPPARAMKIKIREQNVDVGRMLRAHAQSRIRLTLARFGDRIGEVAVRFSDDGLKGLGLGRRCEIEVGLSLRRVRAADEDADLFAALDRAAARVARSVARALEQEHELEARVVGVGTFPRGKRKS